MHRRIERFTRALDAPSLDLVGPVEIDEVYVSDRNQLRTPLPKGRTDPIGSCISSIR
jgi:hypothetical protein